jgi:WD40 repeat protein
VLATLSKSAEDTASGGEVWLWEAITGRLLAGPLPAGKGVTRVLFSPAGDKLLTQSDKGFRLWDRLGRAVRVEPIWLGGWSQEAVFSPNGRVLAIRDGSEVRLWDADTGESLGKPLAHSGPVTALAFSRDSLVLLAGVGDRDVRATATGEARFWDVRTLVPLGPAVRLARPVTELAITPDGRTAVIATREGKAAGSFKMTATVVSVPSPAGAEPERLRAWTEVLTGLELDADGMVRPLDATAWKERADRLRALGGPPAP